MNKFIVSFLAVVTLVVSSFGISSYASTVEESVVSESPTTIIFVPYVVHEEQEQVEKSIDSACLFCHDDCQCEGICECCKDLLSSTLIVLFSVVILSSVIFFLECFWCRW